MKSLIKKTSIIFIVLSMMSILCLGLFGFKEKESIYAAADEWVGSYYLDIDGIDGEDPYESIVKAGTTSGYDNYRVDQEDVVLHTEANPGFQFKYWYVSIGGTKVQIVNDTEISGIEFSVGSVDTDRDGYNEESTITMSSVAQDMYIEPVFDYIYYNVNLDQIIKYDNYNASNNVIFTNRGTGVTEYLYYSHMVETESIITYKNAIHAFSDGAYTYVGDIHTNDEGETFYILHKKNDGTEDYVAVEPSYYTQGGSGYNRLAAFRYGDIINIARDIDCQGSFENNKYIKIKSLSTTGATLNSSTITNHAGYGYTTSFEVNFTVEGNVNLNADITELNKVTVNVGMLDRYIDAVLEDLEYNEREFTGGNYLYGHPNNSGSYININGDAVYQYTSGLWNMKSYDDKIAKDTISADLREKLLGGPEDPGVINIDGTTYFAKIDNAHYLTSADTPNIRISYNSLQNESLSASLYDAIYFDYQPVSGIGGQTAGNSLTVDRDTTITVYYAPSVYEINYEFRKIDGGVISTPAGTFNVHETKYVKPGTTVELSTMGNAPSNTGYQFKAYYDASGKEITSVIMDENNPSDAIVYMAYEAITYELYVKLQSDTTLTDTVGNTIYPVREFSYWNGTSYTGINIGNSIMADGATNDYKLLSDGDGVKVIGFNIGDTIKINTTLNNGFKILNITIYDGGTFDFSDLTGGVYSIEMYDTVVNGAVDMGEGKAHRLTAQIEIEYVTYDLDYYIQTVVDTDDGTQKMAHLEVDNVPSYASATSYYGILTDEDDKYVGPDGSATNDGIVQAIKITGLRLHDKITLISMPESYAAGKYYLFSYYKKGYTALEYTIAEQEEVASRFECDEIIDGNTFIEVRYVLADSTLNVNLNLVNGTPDCVILDNSYIEIYQDKDGDGGFDELIAQGDSFEINFQDNIDWTKITAVIDLSGTAFGYRLYDVDKFGISGERPDGSGDADVISSSLDTGILTIQFKIMTDCSYALTINFELIEYTFKIEDEYGIHEDVLTVQDSELSFLKPYGKYVSSVTSGKSGNEITSPNIKETNENRNSADKGLYRYDFDRSDFETFIGNYKETGSDIVNLGVVYADYEYKITIHYDLLGKKGYRGESENYPNASIDIVAFLNNGYETEFFTGVVHGSNATISIDFTNVYGLKFNGLKYFEGNPVQNNGKIQFQIDGSEIVFTGLDSDYEFSYSLAYVQYSFVSIYDSDAGEPTIRVRGNGGDYMTTTSFTQFDDVHIASTANARFGFGIDSILTEYKYIDDAQYAEDLSNGKLYIKDGRDIILANTTDHAEYDEDLTYLVKLNNGVEGVVEYLPFDLANFVSQSGNIVNLYFTYTMKEVKITNSYAFLSNRNLNKGNGEYAVAFDTDDIATFTVYATLNNVRGEDSWLELGKDDTVNYSHKVRVVIQINKEATEMNSGTKYDLSSIVSLSTKNNSLSLKFVIGGAEYSLDDVDAAEGKYVVEFPMNDENIITKVGDTIELKYYYVVSECELVLTTNITNKQFYSGNTDLLRVNVAQYGFGSNAYNKNSVELKKNISFLGTAQLVYSLGSKYIDLFKISSIKVYDADGNILNGDNIHVELKDDGTIEYVMINRIEQDIKVEFIVQPIIKIKTDSGYEVVNLGTYDVNKEFKCDATANGLAQTINVGEVEDGLNDIVMAGLIKDAVQFEYYDQFGLPINDPTNVGTYTIKLLFENTPEFAWLSEFSENLNCTINLKIQPKMVTFGYNEGLVVQTEKTYDTLYNFPVDVLKNYLTVKFTDYTGNNVVMLYTDAIKSSLFNLDNSAYAWITKNVGGEEIVTYQADESMYYNVTVYSLNLQQDIRNNRNFSLSRDYLTIENIIKINRVELIVEGIVINDKVLDLNNATAKDATVDVSNAKFTNLVGNDNVSLDITKIVAKFEFATEGEHNVSIDLTNALTGVGEDYLNYKIGVITGRATIYPYVKTCNVSGIGTFTIKNDRGLVDSQYIDLIPVHSILVVERVDETHRDLSILRRSVSSHLSRMNVFGMGLKFYIMLGTERFELSNKLILITPEFEGMNDLLWANGESGKLEYTINENDHSLVINLEQLPKNLSYLVVTEHRELLELWQIILIISAVVLVIIVIVIIALIIRRKRQIKDSQFDKI